MLWSISTSNPFVPDINRMSRELDISKEYLNLYFDYLEKAALLINVRHNAEGMKLARKQGKVFIENTNLMNAINGELNIGNNTGHIRETFFANQMNNTSSITLHQKGDFFIDNQFVFEVGGKNKTLAQIKYVKKSYLAVDNITIGFGKKIPLWLFGFLY